MQLKANVSIPQLAAVIKNLSLEDKEWLELILTGEDKILENRLLKKMQWGLKKIQGQQVLKEFFSDIKKLNPALKKKIFESLFAAKSERNSEILDNNIYNNIFTIDFPNGKKQYQIYYYHNDNDQKIPIFFREKKHLMLFL